MKIFRPALLVYFLAIASGFAFAETIEESEAKRRGVPLEVVQLENARDRIAYLEKQVAELTAKNAALEKKLAAGSVTTQTATTQAAPSPEIAKAIKEHRICRGMTVEQANKALGSWGNKLSEDEDGNQTYQWKIYHNDANANQPATLAGSVTATVRDGKVVSWSN